MAFKGFKDTNGVPLKEGDLVLHCWGWVSGGWEGAIHHTKGRDYYKFHRVHFHDDGRLGITGCANLMGTGYGLTKWLSNILPKGVILNSTEVDSGGKVLPLWSPFNPSQTKLLADEILREFTKKGSLIDLLRK